MKQKRGDRHVIRKYPGLDQRHLSPPKDENGKRGRGRIAREHGPGGIVWDTVREYARLGADKELIMAAIGVAPEVLREPDTLTRFSREVARGEALHQIDLLRDVRRVRNGGPGKVNAVLASLRQKLHWNRPDSSATQASAKPDTDVAVAEIQKMLKRFRTS